MAVKKKQVKPSGAKRGASKGGRPSSFRPEYERYVRFLCRRGATDAELAEMFGVTEQTVNNWKQAHPEFFGSLKDGKAEADAEVERSLFERATGYEHQAVKFHVIDGAVQETPYVERYAPDTTAAIFWLKNRKPAEWRDRQDVAHSGTVTLESLILASFGKDEA